MSKLLYSNKKMEKTVKVRIILIVAIMLGDIILLPWLLKFPFFLKDDMINAPNKWFAYGLINSYKDVIFNKLFRNLFLFMQLPVVALILSIAWNTEGLRRKNRIKDGIGGPEPAGQGQHGTSRWQTKWEMDKTAFVWDGVTPISAGGIVLGMEKSKKANEKIWFNTEDVHNLQIGATRSGKDRKLLMPSMWVLANAGESMVLGDPKGEMYITSRDWLKSMGYNIIVLNLREPVKGNQHNYLHLVNKAVDEGNVAKATELAWDIANAITRQKPPSTSEPIWENGEESTIAALILLAALDSEFKFQRHMTTAYYLLAEYGQPLDDDSIPLLDYIKGLPVRHPAKSAFATASIAPYKTRASFFTTALSDLRLFSDPNISDMTSKQDHDLESIGIEKTAVFLIIPDEKSTRNVLATLYIDQLYQSLVELATKRGGRIPRRVNFILNEFGNLPPIPDFDKKLTVGGGRGIRFCMAIQDIAQLKKLYKDNAQTITGNCHIWTFLKTADVETAKLISEKTGKYTVETENSSSSVQSKGHSRSYGVGLTGRALLLPDEVLRWNIDESLVLPISYFPARYPLPDLSLWRANKDYGFINPSGDIEADKETNRKIIEERWKNTHSRELQEASIWLPEIEVDETEEETAPPKKNKAVKYESAVIEFAKEEAAPSMESAVDNGEVYRETEVQPTSLGELDIASILKAAGNNQDNKPEDDDFL